MPNLVNKTDELIIKYNLQIGPQNVTALFTTYLFIK